MSQTTEQIQKSDIKDILENSLKGVRPGPEDILRLLKSDDVHLMGLVSGYLSKKQFGNKASFVNNIILNYTNVCIVFIQNYFFCIKVNRWFFYAHHRY